MTHAPRIGFLGAGRMATALARGLIASGFTDPSRILASDVSEDAARGFSQATQSKASRNNASVVRGSEIVLLAVKPGAIPEVLSEVQSLLSSSHLLVSIAAGTTISALEEQAGDECRIIRVMPNTPCLVGAGASAYALGPKATPDDAALVQRMLSTVGIAVQVPEHLLDAVTGLSGSGPAYVFQMIEALSDGGVRMGLPRDIATRLAAQTLVGAGRMVLETGEHPGALKDAVASPGGTTIAGLHALEQGKLRAALMDAVFAATRRSQELGES